MDEPLSIAFKQACNGEFRDVTRCRGHIVHAFYCAFWGLFQFDNYKTAIDSIISLSPEEEFQLKFVNLESGKKRSACWRYGYKRGNCWGSFGSILQFDGNSSDQSQIVILKFY